jgi:threonine dehydrogenase-like Zn-dependent dehydrogenase
MDADLIIRGGTIVDGSGAAARRGDVAIAGDRIVAVEDRLDARASREIDAEGRLVTPGFVDVHTHLDAQLGWDPLPTSSCWHGITSVVLGNCGVTFAPVGPGQREFLAEMMESVEDIPRRAILEGLPWDWTSYGDYLGWLDRTPKGINVGGLVGHCAMRVAAMGERSMVEGSGTADDIARMCEMAEEALRSGALGISTSRTFGHVVPDGRPVPGTWAGPDELLAFADVLRRTGRGLFEGAIRLGERRFGVQSACSAGGFWGYPDRDGLLVDGGQGEYVRVPLADGTLVSTRETPDAAMVPSLLALSDVMGTGWHAAVAAGVSEGDTVVVVGDGAVGLSGVLAASRMGAERVVAMSRHESRQRIARSFGATDVVAERGEAGEDAVRELTGGVGADAVLECVGTGQAMNTALAVARPGATVGYVGVPHGVELPVGAMFARNVGVAGGIAPVRQYLPALRDDVLAGKINPGLVFDLELPLDQVAQGYTAMDERRAIKTLLRP